MILGLTIEDWIGLGGLLVLAALMVNVGWEVKKAEARDDALDQAAGSGDHERAPPEDARR